MKSKLAKARDKWLLNEEGQGCCHGTATGQYLQNRLVRAFLAGAKHSDERIEELDKLRASVKVSLIGARAAVQKGGKVTEETLKELIDELEV